MELGTQPFSAKPLPQPLHDNGNQDYSFDLLGPEAQNPPPQAVRSSSARPLPQPPPDDGNQDYTFDSLIPLPQATRAADPMPTRPLPQPPPDDGNQDYTFDSLISLPQPLPEGGTHGFDMTSPPSYPPPSYPTDDGNQDYTFDMLTPLQAPPPPIPSKMDSSSQLSKPPLPKAIPTSTPPLNPTVTTSPRGDASSGQRPLPPPPPGDEIPPDDGNQDYTFDSLTPQGPPPTPVKILTPAHGMLPIVVSQKPPQSPPIPPKSKSKGAGPVGTPGREDLGVQSRDPPTTPLNVPARAVATTTPFPKSPVIGSLPKPPPTLGRTPVSKAGAGVNPSDSKEGRELPLPPTPASSLRNVPPPARLEPPEVSAPPNSVTSSRKAAPLPQGGGPPPTIPEARPIVTAPTHAHPAPPTKGNMATDLQSTSAEYCLLGHEEDPAGLTLSQGGGGRRGTSEPIGVPSPTKGNMATNLQSKSSEYCLLGHEEDPAGLTLSQGGGGRRGASEPIGVPSKGGTSAPIKPQQATGQATGRKNMPVRIVLFFPSFLPHLLPPSPHPSPHPSSHPSSPSSPSRNAWGFNIR